MDVVTLSAAKADAKRTYVPIGWPYQAGAFTRFMDTLSEGVQSVALGILSDSTGYTLGTTRWPYLVAPWLAAQFPSYAVQTLTFNVSSQAYDAPVIVSGTPTARKATLNGTTSLIHPGDGTAITGDIDIRAKVAFPTWSGGPGTAQTVASRWGGSAGLNSWIFSVTSGGTIQVSWSTDGTAIAFTKASTTLTMTANTALWIRAVLIASTGVMTFSTSTDGINYTTLSTATAVGATSLYDPGTAQKYGIGAFSGASTRMTGDVYAVEVRNGSGGLSVVPRYPDNWGGYNAGIGPAPATFSGSPVLSIVNASIPGAPLSYLSDSTRLPKMLTVDYGLGAIIVSCAHNDARLLGAPYLASWDSWLAAIRARTSSAEVAVTIQNPRIGSVTSDADAHRQRCYDLRCWAARNALSIIDVYRAFIESSTPLTTLVDPADGVHPTDAAGSPLWAATVETAMLGRS